LDRDAVAHPPDAWWPVLALTVAGYLAATHAVKMWLVRRGWID